MKRECTPNSTSPLISYCNATIECLERPIASEDTDSRISGRAFHGGKLSWLARGACLEVVNTITGFRRAAWRFGWNENGARSVCITSVAEFPMEDGMKLVVGLKNTSGALPGMVCLFDPFVSRVIKAIEIPYPVTVVETITSSGGAGAPPHAHSAFLKLFFGILAVSTEQGHTYLIDMRVDDEAEQFDEWNPSHIELVNCGVQDVAAQRVTAKEQGGHLAVELAGQCHGIGTFSFIGPDHKEIKSLSSGNVCVAAVKYVRQTSSLLVGFNFGCFQIWDLETLALVYSSQVDQYLSSVTHFMYQEPENDPRHCCYIWVARGPRGSGDVDTPTMLTLYQLSYGSKDTLPGYGVIYRELAGCGRRFEHQLTADVHHLADATSVGSRVICCYTLEKEGSTFDNIKLDDSTDEDALRTRDLTLAVCVWEAPSHDPHSSPTCHLGIFDINRWYHSQMLPSIRDAMFGSKDPTCSFFAFFSLAEVLETGCPDGIVDVFVDVNSVSRYVPIVGPALEQHFWPTSLKFDSCSVMETGLVRSKFLGAQRQILADMSARGAGCLSEAHEFFNRCYIAGLLPRNFDLSKPQEKSFHLEALLSVSLENSLLKFITSCIQKLGASNVTHVGSTLRLILDWAWERVIYTKEQLDKLCVPLFDGQGGTPDDQMLLMLDYHAVQLGHLEIVFQALLTQSAPMTNQGVKDIEDQYNVVVILNQYVKVIQWLVGHGLLPEHTDERATASRRGHIYPGVALGKMYELRRKELTRQSSEFGEQPLLIDKLVAQLGSQVTAMWTGDGGTGNYPPASLQNLCSLFLLEKNHPNQKHIIVYYLLLDLCCMDDEMAKYQIADMYSKAFDIPLGLAKLVHAFWLLDHKDFQEALNAVTDPDIKTEIETWQNSYIIKLFFLQGEAKKALHFIRTVRPAMHTPEDVKLHLTILLANGLVVEAFHFQRQQRDPSRRLDLLDHFFTGCQETRNMNKLLQLPFDHVEEGCLVKFLLESPVLTSKELLVMHHLQRGRYVEGIRLNELLKQDPVSVHDRSVIERAKVRNAIVDGYIKCLPPVQRKLIFGPDKPPVPLVKHREVPRPKPLSTVVHRTDRGRPVSHSMIVNSVMDKVAEARMKKDTEEVQAETSRLIGDDVGQTREARPFVCTPVTPRAKSMLSDVNKVIFASVQKTGEDVPHGKTREYPEKPMMSPTFLDKRRRRQLYSGAEALSLLSTPQIAKRTPGSVAATRPDHIRTATPQSILKVTRVVRRTSPRQSPGSSPPVTRHGSSEQLVVAVTPLTPDGTKEQVDAGRRDVQFETPSRRIRFAVEDKSPSPLIISPVKRVPPVQTIPKTAAEDEQMEVSFTEPASPPLPLSDGVREHATSSSETRGASPKAVAPAAEGNQEGDESETEVQITAAVVDLTEDSDLDDRMVQDEEEVDSYEVDESDGPIDSDEDVQMRAKPTTAVPHVTEQSAEQPGTSAPTSNENQERLDMSDEGKVQVTLVRVSPDASPARDASPVKEREVREVHRVEYTDSPEGVRIETHITETTEIITTKEEVHGGARLVRPPCSPGQDSPVFPQAEHLLPGDSTSQSSLPPASPPRSPQHSSPPPSQASPKLPSPQVPFQPSPQASLNQPSPQAFLDQLSPQASPKLPSPQASPKPPSPQASRKQPSPQASPRRNPPRETRMARFSPAGATIGITPPTSPEMPRERPGEKPLQTHLMESADLSQAQASSEKSFAFSPPTVIRTPQALASTSIEVQTTPSLEYLFSPPLTRSMAKRRSLDVARSGQVTRSPARPESRATPHQSPSDSPISFISPVPREPTSPRSRKSGQRQSVKPRHGMTLRARKCPGRQTRSAKLPHIHL